MHFPAGTNEQVGNEWMCAGLGGQAHWRNIPLHAVLLTTVTWDIIPFIGFVLP